MKLYFGTPGFGWIMYGIGYKDKWFLGFSMNRAIEAKEGKNAKVD